MTSLGKKFLLSDHQLHAPLLASLHFFTANQTHDTSGTDEMDRTLQVSEQSANNTLHRL